MTTVKVKQPANEVPVEILANEIQKIAAAAATLIKSRLKFSTIVFLVAKSAGVGIRDTENVLLAAKDLAKVYLKPEETERGTK